MIYYTLLIGYLIGSIPFGLILTKFFGYGDIRNIGSGNIGATNVLRTGNKWLALAVLLLDGGKGAFAVLLVQFALTYDASLYAAIGAFLGHVFPVWLKFRGGKGVATALGILLALMPKLGLICCALWLLTAIAFRISSLAALAAIGLSPAFAWYFTKDFVQDITEPDGSTVFSMNTHLDWLPYICGLFAAIVFYKHKDNIQRLLKGEEPKIGKKRNAAPF
jgi:glycerol-3-phosphate acyltransferase PlsY